MQDKNNLEISIPLEEMDGQFIYESYTVAVPLKDSFLDDPTEVKKYAKKTIKKHLGDEVDVSKVKVKKPGMFKKSMSKLVGRQPMAHLLVVTKF